MTTSTLEPAAAREATGTEGGITTARPPRVGERAPEFSTQTTRGPVHFPGDFTGRWLVFLTHPTGFTPVCTTEYMLLALMQPEFERLNSRLLGLSFDSVETNIAWLRTVEREVALRDLKSVQITFPVISDPAQRVARAFGVDGSGSNPSRAQRAVIIIDPTGVIRATLCYPPGNGRNLPEIRRLLLALQLSDRHNVETPANWQPGEDVIVPLPASHPGRQLLENPFEDIHTLRPAVPLTGCPK